MPIHGSEVNLNFLNLITAVVAVGTASLCHSCHPRTHHRPTSPEIEQEQFHRFLDSLNQAGISEFEKANGIRKYLAQRLKRGTTGDSLSVAISHALRDSLQPFKCLALMQSGEVEGTCALSSWLLGKLLAEAGYNGYIYNCGFDNSRFTHQFNLIEIDGKLIVQDAHYNITITDKAGAPKNFLDVLAEIKVNDFNNIIVSEGALIKAGRKTHFSAIAKKRLGKMMPFIKANGLPENFLSIYLKPLHVMDGSNGEPAIQLKEIIIAAARPD